MTTQDNDLRQGGERPRITTRLRDRGIRPERLQQGDEIPTRSYHSMKGKPAELYLYTVTLCLDWRITSSKPTIL